MKIFLLFLISFLSGISTYKHAQQPARSSVQNSLLWEISGNGLTASSYLFGTYHFAGKSFADSLPVIGEKFNMCKAVAGEFVIDPSALSKMGPAMMLTNNTLDKIFTPEEYALIADSVKSLTKMNLKTFNTIKPAALEIFLLSAFAPKTTSPTNPALDQYFQNEGKKHGDKILGLETIEFQIELLLNAPLEDQKRHLLTVIREMKETRKNLDEMYSLYRQQDLDEIYKMMMETDKEYTPEEKDQLLKNRNLKWVEEIPGIIKDQPTFIAVGAAHLPGEFGLINQLRLKGYTVSAVKI